jgi:phosphate transport system ATP-binding protein
MKRDVTTVLVTHNLTQARRLADVVVFLYGGKLIEAAPAEQLFSAPREELTRNYIAGAFE